MPAGDQQTKSGADGSSVKGGCLAGSCAVRCPADSVLKNYCGTFLTKFLFMCKFQESCGTGRPATESVVFKMDRYQNKVMVSDELPDGQMVDQWEPIGQDSIQTPLEVS